MKKQIIIILSILLVFTLSACNTNNELIGRIITYDDFSREIPKRIELNNYNLEENHFEYGQEYIYTSKTDCELEESKRNFAIEVDGIKFNLPITIKEFVDLGFKLSYIANEETVELNTQITSDSFVASSPKGNTFMIYATSKDRTLKPIEDLHITQVSCSFCENNTNYGSGERSDAPKIKFFNNVSGKSSVDNILEELKTPERFSLATSQYNGETTLTIMQFYFYFSDETYNGSLAVTAHPVRDKTIKRTSFVTDFSYRIEYKNT